MSESVGGAILVILGAIGIVFLWAIGGALIGAFAGWILSLTPINAWIDSGVHSIFPSVVHVDMVGIGALCGFVGGFFKSSGDEK